ncbi:MAG: hypothetical protein H6719_20710 [Sandaracinaceae bacterium]|nr:hypothetical protein [Sandaracinaceae bacterium]
MRAALAALVLLTGCFAAPPAPASSAELTGCRPGAHGALSRFECTRDSECVLCGCDRIESRDHLLLTNAACPPDPACDAEAHCCLGRCVRTLGPPAF